MEEKYFKQFKINLLTNRKQLGLTQKQVAQKLGITPQSYNAYESGVALPTLANFVKLCLILDVTPNDLLEFD